MKREKGFTLVELLVVIAVIALLMSILMPVLRKARDQAMRIICGSHIRNLQLGQAMYADSHNNRIMTGGGNWPWDVPFNCIYNMLKYMGTDMSALPNVRVQGDLPVAYSENFYCPANTPQKRARHDNWHFVNGNPNNPNDQGFAVASFFYTWPAGWNSNGKAPITGLGPQGLIGNAQLQDPSKMWVSRLDVPLASSREFIIDATISQTGSANDPYFNPAQYPLGNFAMILCGGNPGGAGIPDSTNHMISDTKVAGGNVGYLDGHVEFRSWSEMRCRWNIVGGCPKWWW